MIISRAQFFARPKYAFPLISPDGQFIAYLHYQENQASICIINTGDSVKDAKTVYTSPVPSLHFQWATSSEYLLISEPSMNEAKTRLFSLDIISQVQKELMFDYPGRLHLLNQSYESVNTILVGSNHREPRWHDIYQVNITSDETRLIYENNQFSGFLAAGLELSLGVQDTADGGCAYVQFINNKPEKTVLSVDKDNAQTTIPVSFDTKNKRIYLKDTRDHDTSVLSMLQLDTNSSEVLVSDEQADIDDVLIDPVTNQADAVATNYSRKQWQTISTAYKDDFNVLNMTNPGDLSISNRTADNRQWIVGFANDTEPNCYYLYQRESRHATKLFSNIPEFDDLPLNKMQYLITPASTDARPVLSYFTLPHEPKESIPLVVLIHGGPWSRDKWGYQPWHQWLANRGYAVLSVNFRGSTGFGKDFINAGNQQWGADMLADIYDVTLDLCKHHAIDQQRIGLMGTSYGGYAAIMLATYHPEQFQCAIDLFGPTDLLNMIESIPPQWQSQRELFYQRVGNPETEEGRARLEVQSPVNQTNKIQTPLLIVDGQHDPRVGKNMVDVFVNKLRQRDKNSPLIHITFPNEGHNLTRQENRIAFCSVAELFLHQYLGGKVEPVSDQQIAAMHIPVGREDLRPG